MWMKIRMWNFFINIYGSEIYCYKDVNLLYNKVRLFEKKYFINKIGF